MDVLILPLQLQLSTIPVSPASSMAAYKKKKKKDLS
jgi:hypothetical protein